MNKKTFCYIIFSFALILGNITYTTFFKIKAADAYDSLKPNFEIDNLYASQKKNIPVTQLEFYEKAKNLSFESSRICQEMYHINFDDIPVNSLKGIPGSYRYFMEQGNIYATSKNKMHVGKFTVLLLKVESVQLRNTKIKIDFEASNDDLFCSYMKLVYLHLNGQEEVKYIPIGTTYENKAAVTINRNETCKFLKAIYIFCATKNNTVSKFHLQDLYHHMEIEYLN